jgi:hypothetical protein
MSYRERDSFEFPRSNQLVKFCPPNSQDFAGFGGRVGNSFDQNHSPSYEYERRADGLLQSPVQRSQSGLVK